MHTVRVESGERGRMFWVSYPKPGQILISESEMPGRRLEAMEKFVPEEAGATFAIVNETPTKDDNPPKGDTDRKCNNCTHPYHSDKQCTVPYCSCQKL